MKCELSNVLSLTLAYVCFRHAIASMNKQGLNISWSSFSQCVVAAKGSQCMLGREGGSLQHEEQ